MKHARNLLSITLAILMTIAFVPNAANAQVSTAISSQQVKQIADSSKTLDNLFNKLDAVKSLKSTPTPSAIIPVTSQAEIQDAINNSTDTVVLEMQNDITVTSSITMNSKDIILVGNGHTLSVAKPGVSEDCLALSNPSSYNLIKLLGNTRLIAKGVTMIGGSYRTVFVDDYALCAMLSCTISRSAGGGIDVYGRLFLRNCNLIRNQANNGSGFLAEPNSFVVLDRCSFSENRNNGTYGGGGCEAKSNSTLICMNTTMSNNLSGEIGGAINVFGASAYFLNTTVSGNVTSVKSSPYYGGGLGINSSNPVYCVNTVLLNNFANGLNVNDKSSDIGVYSGSDIHLIHSAYGVVQSKSGASFTFREDVNNKQLTTTGVFSNYIDAKVVSNTGELGTALLHKPVLAPNEVGTKCSPLAIGSGATTGGTNIYANIDYNHLTAANVKLGYGTDDNITVIGNFGMPTAADKVTDFQDTSERDGSTIGAAPAGDVQMCTVTLRKPDNGHATGASVLGDTFAKGDQVVLEAIPNSNYKFAGWQDVDSNTIVSNSQKWVFDIERDMTIKPLFVAANQVPILLPDGIVAPDFGVAPSVDDIAIADGEGHVLSDETKAEITKFKNGEASQIIHDDTANSWVTKDTAYLGSHTYSLHLSAKISDGFEYLAAADMGARIEYLGDAVTNYTISDKASAGDAASTDTRWLTVTFKPFTTHTVTFNTDGGSSIDAATVKDGTPVAKPETDPTKQGSSFLAWQKDNANYDFSTPVTADITLKATYAVSVHTVTFDSDGGSEVASVNVEDGSKVAKPSPDPEKREYEFVSWQKDGVDFDFENTTITADTTLKAKWNIHVHTVTFDSNGGTEVPSVEVTYGDLIPVPDPAPTRAGYTFIGWNLDDIPFNFEETIIYKPETLVAEWAINTYEVTFNTGGGTAIEEQRVHYGDKLEKPAKDPVRAGYTFKGWQVAGKTYNFDAPVESSMELVALWQKASSPSGDADTPTEDSGSTVVPENELVPGTGDNVYQSLAMGALIIAGAACALWFARRRA